MQFEEFVKNKALEDKLPFDIDIKPEAWEGPFANVGRFQLPQYNELLTREAWWLEVLASTVGQRRVELQIELYSLAKLIKSELQLESDSAALKMLSQMTGGADEPPPESETEEQRQARESLNEKKQSFFMAHLNRFTKLADMAAATEEGAVEAWMRITFFLLSRYDANWSFSKTASLRKSEIDALVKFIATEANGGVPPQEQPETEPDLGKQSANSKQPELAGAATG